MAVVNQHTSCFDVLTLYTSRPYVKLIKTLFEIKHYCFKVVEKQFTEDGKYSAG